MDRFHIVVANHQRLFCFVDNFHRILNFDILRDRVYIFDCSPDVEWQKQLAIAEKLSNFGLLWGENLFFVRRRNWIRDQGAHLDYVRCLRGGQIHPPQFVAFMQDHYLDEKRYIKEDSIPENAVYDLDKIENKFSRNLDVGCIFFSRFGIRISASNIYLDNRHWGDGENLFPGAERRCLFVDGNNQVIRPQLYLNWFNTFPRQLMPKCDITNVWEVRLGKILFDQGITWVDMYRDIEYSKISDIDAIEKLRGEKVSKLWYDNRVLFFFGGRDMHKYPPMPVIPIFRYLFNCLRSYLFHPRDATLEFVLPSGSRLR